jgi:hypothetical protein
MKRVLLVFSLVMVFFLACATSGAKVAEPVTYSEIVDVTGVSQSVLYTKANMWFVDAFRSARSVIQFSDKESGVIKGKYIGSRFMTGMYFCQISSTITVEVKEGKYQILFTDPIANTYLRIGDPFSEKPVDTEGLTKKTKEEWTQIAASLKSAILAEETSW